MRRIPFLILLFLPRIAWAQSPVTVTGNVYGATSGYVQFVLQPSNSGVQYFVNGITNVPMTTTCAISGSGTVTAVGGGSCLVWGNDVISPANTLYQVVFAPGGTITNRVNRENITGVAYSLNSPVFGMPVALVPQYNTITVAPIAANIVPGANNTFTLGNAGAYYSAAYISAVFTNNLVTTNFSITGTFTAANVSTGAITATSITVPAVNATTITATSETLSGNLQSAAVILPNNASPPATTVGQTIIYTDNTGTAKICPNGSACVSLIGGGGGGGGNGWSYSSPVISETTTTDHVVIGATSIGDFSGSPFNGSLVDTNYIYTTNGTTTNSSVGAFGFDSGTLTLKLASGATGSGTNLPLAFQTGQLSPGTIRGGFSIDGLFITGPDTASGSITSLFPTTDVMEGKWSHNGDSNILMANRTAGTVARSQFVAQNDIANGQTAIGATSSAFSTAGGLTSRMGYLQTGSGLTAGLNIQTATGPIEFSAGGSNNMTLSTGGVLSLPSHALDVVYGGTGNSSAWTSSGVLYASGASTTTTSANFEYTALSGNLTLTFPGTSGTPVMNIDNTSSTGGQSMGLFIAAGASSSDYSLKIQAHDASTLLFAVAGDGLFQIGATISSASVAANFTATKYFTFRDGTGTTYYIPARASSW